MGTKSGGSSFAGSAVMVLEGAMQVTVEDCKFLHPVSEIANHRRYAFHTLGQLTLFSVVILKRGTVILQLGLPYLDLMLLYNVIPNGLIVSVDLLVASLMVF